MSGDRLQRLGRYGRLYGELALAITFTDGLLGERAKSVTSKGWNRTEQLPHAARGEALLTSQGLLRNPVVVLASSGLIGVDVDGEGGRNVSRALVHGGWPETVTVRSGRADGGLHLWYRPPAGDWPAKVELSGNGLKTAGDGYLVVPPALHGETGNEYVFVEGHAPWELPLAVLPARVLEGLVAARQNRNEAERSDDASPVTEGDRHDFLMRKGCAMRRAGFGETAIRAALLVENGRRCKPPKDKHLVEELAADIATRYAPGART